MAPPALQESSTCMQHNNIQHGTRLVGQGVAKNKLLGQNGNLMPSMAFLTAPAGHGVGMVNQQLRQKHLLVLSVCETDGAQGRHYQYSQSTATPEAPFHLLNPPDMTTLPAPHSPTAPSTAGSTTCTP
jgi:hypothetical protein